jgi:hypothetical protein
MRHRSFGGGIILAAALALVLLPGTMRAQENGHDAGHSQDHHSQSWKNRHRHSRAHYRDSREPSGWDRGHKTGWRNCADLPPGQAKKEGCRDSRARHGRNWRQASHRRENWREHRRGSERVARRDRGHHDADRDHNHDHDHDHDHNR